MKTEALKEGEIYKCKLSKENMLIIKSTKTITKGEGEDATQEQIEIKAGKYVIHREDGVIQFAYDELYDGQLEEINNN